MVHKHTALKTKNKINTFLVLLIILINSKTANFLGSDIFILGVFLFSGIVFKLKKHSVDKFIIKIILFYIFINILSFFYNKTSFDYITFLGYILQILSSYFMIKIIGFDFFKKLEKIIFTLTLISLPLYFLEQLFRSEFISLSPFLNFITGEEQKEFGGWYIFVYMFSAWGRGRNSGFMWEPGAFALMIILGLILHYFLNNGKLNTKRFSFYIISLITTFSTMGYVVFLLLFATYIVQKKISFYWFVLFPFLIIILIYMTELPFIGQELKIHYESSGIFKEKTINETEIIKLNRLGFINIAIKESFKWPFGFGNIKSRRFISEFDTDKLIGASSFGQILFMWGWLGIYFWIKSTYLFIKTISINKLNKIGLFLLTAAIILAFSSNPLPKSPILMIIIYTPYIFKYLRIPNYQFIQKHIK